jgi:hypothetical protein
MASAVTVEWHSFGIGSCKEDNMTLRSSILVVCVAVLALAGQAWAQQSETRREPAAQQLPSKEAGEKPTPEQPSQEFVEIDETIWLRLADEPHRHMEKAHEEFTKKEFHLAATELRKAAAYLHAAAHHSTKVAKNALTEAASELDRLAMEVTEDSVKSSKSLDAAFARAEHALARYHEERAKEAMDKGHRRTAGEYLHSAITHVENAAKWTGHKLEKGSVEALNFSRTVSGKLIDGAGIAVDEVGKGIEFVGKETEQLGQHIKPHQERTASGVKRTR